MSRIIKKDNCTPKGRKNQGRPLTNKTGRVQKVAQLHDSYTTMMIMTMMIFLTCGMFSAILRRKK